MTQAATANYTDSSSTPQRISASFRDPSGFVFEFDERIFRALDQSCLNVVHELHDTGLLSTMIEQGLLVGTSIVDERSLGRKLAQMYPRAAGFLEHQRIDYLSYPYEWTPAMLADAGLATLDLQMRLLEHGFSLKDATAYNIQFVNGRPVFIDVPSIERPARLDVWVALGQFSRMFTYPLLLNRCKGQSIRGYFLANLDGKDVVEVRKAFGIAELFKPSLLLDLAVPYLLSKRQINAPWSAGKLESRDTSASSQVFNLRRLRSKIIKLTHSSHSAGNWANYPETCSYSPRAERCKSDQIEGFLNRFSPATVLDVGCNTGRYSRLAARSGATVLATDRDVDCVDLLYRSLKTEPSNIQPLCIDICNPSPAIGYCNRERPGFMERARMDCVLALALIHHLHVSANLPLESISDLFAQLTRQFLVLEFVPREDVMFQRLLAYRSESFDHYTLDKCIQAFQSHFKLIQRVDITESRRTLLFWRKTSP